MEDTKGCSGAVRALPLRVACVLSESSLVSSVVLPVEMWRAAADLARAARLTKTPLRLETATLDDRPFRTAQGLLVSPTIAVRELSNLDLLYLPAIWRNPLRVLPHAGRVLETLPDLVAAGARICSVATGAYLTAEAGLLEGRPATTHWRFLDHFERRYPGVQLRRNHLITRSGDLYCAASINAVADLTVHLIEKVYGAEIARGVGAQFSPEVRRPYPETAFTDGGGSGHGDELMADAQLWLQARMSESCRLNELAAELGISRRTLDRRFRAAVGMSPGRWLLRLRVGAACELLRGSNSTIGEIATRVGIPDRRYFATTFRRQMRQSPSEYRKSVRGKLFVADVSW